MTAFVPFVFLWTMLIAGTASAMVHPPVFCNDSIPFNLEAPSIVINLASPDLKEISGLSLSGEPGIFCAISDEKGEVLFIDGVGGGKIRNRVPFRDKGDFEGVEKVKERLYAVKSDGDLYAVHGWECDKIRYEKFETGLSKSDDVEGLGYDPKRNALLVACKGDPDSTTLRPIYAFDLHTNKLSAQPVYTIDPLEVNARIPYDEDDKKHYFSTSGVAIHPLTGEVYVISTALKRLVVLDYETGTIREVARLSKHLLPQPEGIAFDLEGNLYLSSEGKKGEDAMLVRYDYRKSN